VRIVKQYEKGVLFRLGRLQGVRDLGFRVIVPLADTLRRASLRADGTSGNGSQVRCRDVFPRARRRPVGRGGLDVGAAGRRRHLHSSIGCAASCGQYLSELRWQTSICGSASDLRWRGEFILPDRDGHAPDQAAVIGAPESGRAGGVAAAVLVAPATSLPRCC